MTQLRAEGAGPTVEPPAIAAAARSWKGAIRDETVLHAQAGGALVMGLGAQDLAHAQEECAAAARSLPHARCFTGEEATLEVFRL